MTTDMWAGSGEFLLDLWSSHITLVEGGSGMEGKKKTKKKMHVSSEIFVNMQRKRRINVNCDNLWAINWGPIKCIHEDDLQVHKIFAKSLQRDVVTNQLVVHPHLFGF